MRTLPVREGYDRWAEIYDGDGNRLIALEERYVGNLIGDVAGRDVADLQVRGLADALSLEGGSPPANARG